MHSTSPLLVAMISGIVLSAILRMWTNQLRISPLVGYLITGTIFDKSIITHFKFRLFGNTKQTALTILARPVQVGEFAFILAAFAKTLEVFPDNEYSLILAGIIISIVINPIVFDLAKRFLSKTKTIIDSIAVINQLDSDNFKNYAILVGYGCLGRTIASQLKKQGIAFVAISNSFTFIEQRHLNNIVAILSDTDKSEILGIAQPKTAIWLILCYKSKEIYSLARVTKADLGIYVSTFNDDQVEHIVGHDLKELITGRQEIPERILDLMNITSNRQNKDEEKKGKNTQNKYINLC
ncbi:NAD-binding protein [Frischella perrara]|uniref:NAD-binding protein n=1 Tax=Frischella perrara TaxID=1267021 RepID=UPI0023F3F4BA|nr:NAD-binding protein [Frischella perrara]